MTRKQMISCFQVLANMILCDLEFWRNKKNVPVEQLRLKPEHLARATDLKCDNVLTNHLVLKSLDLFLNEDQV